MNICQGDYWKRRGFSLLWDPRALTQFVAADSLLSMRQLFTLRKSWPDRLSGPAQRALVVGGLDGCLDSLSTQEAASWLENDVRSLILSFQDYYGGNAALILWLASGRSRIVMDPASEEYSLKPGAGRNTTLLPIGRLLWSGAASDDPAFRQASRSGSSSLFPEPPDNAAVLLR